MEFSPADARHIQAAEGWLGLGDHLAANEELDAVSPRLRAHPLVLKLRWHIYAAEKKWEQARELAAAVTAVAPYDAEGWVHLCFALHELKRTREARDMLLQVVERFPEDAMMRYNLACYECQLGDLKAARGWLEKAFTFGDAARLKLMALDDRDLEPLWAAIGGI